MDRRLRYWLATASVGWQISDLFRGGVQGFDFTNLSATATYGPGAIRPMFGTSTGLLPVTVSGASVGQLLDKSQGMALGPEMLVNGDFASGTAPWTNGGTNATLSNPSASCRITRNNVAAYAYAEQAFTQVVGASYLFDADLLANPSGSNGFAWNGFGTTVIVAPGHVRAAPTAVTGPCVIQFGFNSGSGALNDTQDWDNASLRRINGNHANQISAGARPQWIANAGLPYLSFDGLAQYLSTQLVPGLEMTVAACVRSSQDSVVIGSADASDNRSATIIVRGNGQVGGSWRNQNSGVINSGALASYLNTDLVLLMRANASVVELWANGQRVYVGAAVGAPNLTVPPSIGAFNSNGVISTYTLGRIPAAFAVNRYISDGDVRPLMRLLGATAGLSF